MIRFVLVLAVLVSVGAAVFAAPVHDAAAKNDLQKLQALIKEDPGLLNAPDKDGATPLHHAAAKGADAVADYLIEQKANLTARKSDGVTPLHVAAGTGQTGIVEMLLKAGADAKAVDKKGRTPLSLAQERDYPEIAKAINDHLKPSSPTIVKPPAPAVKRPPSPTENVPVRPPDLKKKTGQLVRLAAKQDFVGVEKMFDDKLRSAMPAPSIQTAWNAVTTKNGAFVKIAGLRETKEQGLNVVYATLQFEKGSGDIKLVFNSIGQLSGLWILPPGGEK